MSASNPYGTYVWPNSGPSTGKTQQYGPTLNAPQTQPSWDDYFPTFAISIRAVEMDETAVKSTKESDPKWVPPKLRKHFKGGTELFFCYNGSHRRWDQLWSIDRTYWTDFTEATVIWHAKSWAFIAMNADATASNRTEQGWGEIGFRRVDDTAWPQSHIDFAGDYEALLSPATPAWKHQVIPDRYDYDRLPHHQAAMRDDNGGFDPSPGGLSGNLAIVMALIAFSGQDDDILNILRTSFQSRNWNRHAHNNDRIDRKGKIVKVYRPLNLGNDDKYRFEEGFAKGRKQAPNLPNGWAPLPILK